MNTRLLFFLALFFCISGWAGSPPPEFLASIREAAGDSAWQKVNCISAEGSESADGLKGRWTLVQNPVRGTFSVISDFGIFRSGQGYASEFLWQQDRSGGFHYLNGAFARTAAVTEAWLRRRGYLQNEAMEAEWSEPKPQSLDGRDFTAFSVTPPGGLKAELWFDAKTHLLDRVIQIWPISTYVERYEDYRLVQGVKLPFRIATGDLAAQDDVVSVEAYHLSENEPQITPPLPIQDTHLAAPTTVPLELEGDTVITAILNGKPFDFILDSGGHNILTPAAAKELGLTGEGLGQSGGSGKETLPTQDVRVASLKIGDAVFDDQHFFLIPLQYSTVERGSRPLLAGILGLEVFVRLCVQLDYRAGQLTLMPFAQVPENLPGTRVDLSFNEDMPLVDGGFDGVKGVFAIDTGNAGATIIQGHWAKKHGLAKSLQTGLEGVSFGSGGASRNWSSQGHALTLGGEKLTGLNARYAEDEAGAFSSITEAGNVGMDVLQRYTVTFDYSRQKMILEPKSGYIAPSENRSGLTVTKEDAEAFVVVMARADSPAATAGLQKGDRIVKIDGQAARELSLNDIFKRLRQPPGTVLKMEVEREKKHFPVAITLPGV